MKKCLLNLSINFLLLFAVPFAFSATGASCEHGCTWTPLGITVGNESWANADYSSSPDGAPTVSCESMNLGVTNSDYWSQCTYKTVNNVPGYYCKSYSQKYVNECTDECDDPPVYTWSGNSENGYSCMSNICGVISPEDDAICIAAGVLLPNINGEKDGDETGIDCGGSSGYECQNACLQGAEVFTDMITGKEVCVHTTAANPAGVCPDGWSRIDDTYECTYQYDAVPANSEIVPDDLGVTLPDNTLPEIDNTTESSETTVSKETEVNDDGSVTETVTENTKKTDSDGTTTDQEKVTETTTNTDGSKTEKITTNTTVSTSTGADGTTTTTVTTNTYDKDGNLIGTHTSKVTGKSSNSSGSGSPTSPVVTKVDLDLDPVTDRIDTSNEHLEKIEESLSVEDADPEKYKEELETAGTEILDEYSDELADALNDRTGPNFSDTPFNNNLPGLVENFVPSPDTCQDLVFTWSAVGFEHDFVIECEPFEENLKPVLAWLFYGFTAIFIYYSFTDAVEK